MKRLFGSFAMMLSVATGHCALQAQAHHNPAQHAQERNLTGNWTLSIQDMSMAMVLNQSGTALTGSLDSPHGAIRISGGVDGDTVTFAGASSSAPVVEVSATGTAKGDGSLEGMLTVNVGDAPFAWTAVRAAAK